MASVNPLSRELVFKIVYYGPGLGGKTTSLEHIHATAKPEHRGKLVSLATPVDRTLYFDFLPVRLPPVRGMHIRLQLFTVPGQVYFNATRKLVLTGADGIVFVADSQEVRADANLESLENLRENLADQGREIDKIPIVFQYNKRDLPDLTSVEELDATLNPFGAPSIPSSAATGEGIYETLEKIAERVLTGFKDRLPESPDGEIVSFEAVEGGLVMALRDASARDEPPSDVLVAHILAPGQQHPSIPPLSEHGSDADDPSPEAKSVPPPPVIDDEGDLGARSFADSEPPPADLEETMGEAGQAIEQGSFPRPAQALSFAELWPESEQDMVLDVEEAIARGRYWRAIELCDVLASRIFAAAASLVPGSGSDPSALLYLLGLDGRRYLAFRAIVRDAKGDGLITTRDALAAYAFVIDCRLARSAIH